MSSEVSSNPTAARRRRQKPASRLPLPLKLVGGLLIISALGVVGFTAGLVLSLRNLPDVRALDRYSPSESTRIYDVKGRLIANIHGEANRSVVPLQEVSSNLINAILAIEDDQFYSHNGIRIDTIIRAALTNLQEGRAAQGGSTLTQQLVKNLFFTPKKTLNRKIAEAALALQLERNYDKDKILEMYLNQVYWGHNNYGAETAAQTYFNKHASDLDLAEGAMMAGLLRAPEYYSPFHSMEHARERQRIVLDRMVELKLVSPADADAAKREKLTFGKVRSFRLGLPYVSTFVLRELEERFGEDAVRKGGLQVQTTLDLDLQKLAERSVQADIAQLKKQNRRASEMAVVSLDPRTGFIKAMVGGVNFKESKFNRVTQAYRQPGSAFKPFVYYTAFAQGKLTPDSIVIDSPVTYGTIQKYSPHNYDNRFYGAMSIRKALQQSRNVPTVKIANSIGVRHVIETAQTLGIRTNGWQPNLAVALGSKEVTPLALAGAYASFANGGFGVKPTVLLQVTDREDNILYKGTPDRQLLLNPKAVDMINDCLQSVVTSGTATRAQLADKRPVAGKTGTTSDFKDAWFVGYVPQMVTVMWIGNDKNTPLTSGTAGGTFVAPLWKTYMDQALKGQPALNFPTFGNAAAPVPPPVPPAKPGSPQPTAAVTPTAVRSTRVVPAPASRPEPTPRTTPVDAVRPQRRSQLPAQNLKAAPPPKEEFIP
ncbi:transglycosylase domain-containing protein [Anthocerotibacter panamensis]|uniref:transglycosylase domain-containing protein n=1 Tax=Anthocerotibacter panamensis TaxID=2857077 RepID=UPI001C4081FD|nr:PBP1A family penicillin-binding protein [Anthocerotibacter panamensis]